MNKLLIVIGMFCWAGCSQQEEIVEQYDPRKHEIVSIDTVGVKWGRGFKGMDTTFYKDYHWESIQTILETRPEDSLKVLFIDPIYGAKAIYILDTTFIPLIPLLVSQEEQKSFRRWTGSLYSAQQNE